MAPSTTCLPRGSVCAIIVELHQRSFKQEKGVIFTDFEDTASVLTILERRITSRLFDRASRCVARCLFRQNELQRPSGDCLLRNILSAIFHWPRRRNNMLQYRCSNINEISCPKTRRFTRGSPRADYRISCFRLGLSLFPNRQEVEILGCVEEA